MYLGRLAKWFIYLSDPQCQLRPPAGSAPNFRQMQRLLEISIPHGTTPAIAANMSKAPANARISDAQVQQLKARADEIILPHCARSLVLRKYLEYFVTAQQQAEIAAVEIKGADFADNIYPQAIMRPFTDLDILTPRENIPRLTEIALSLDFESMKLENLKHDDEYGECGFTLHKHGITILLELHWNLVNSPALRAGVSVQYEDVVSDGKITPEGRLIIAAVHACTSHQFDRLKFFFDVAQAVRAGQNKFDTAKLKNLIDQTGCGKILAMSLRLVKNLTGEHMATELAEKLELPRPGILDRILMNRRVISPTSRVILRKARMCGYRHRLKGG